MLKTNQVNQIVESIFKTWEGRVPALHPLNLGQAIVVKADGVYGAVCLGALFGGGVEGKLTLTMEWGLTFGIAEALTHDKVDSFTPTVQSLIEGMFQETINGLITTLPDVTSPITVMYMPTLVDTDILVTEDGKPRAISIPITAKNGVMNIFLSFL